MVSRFFRWRKEKRLGAIRSEREMDQECARFLGYLWEEGEPKQKGADFVSGVQHYCEGLRKRLPRTWRWYGAWNRYEKGDHAPPMERRVALAVADIFWRWGYPRTAALVRGQGPRPLQCTALPSNSEQQAWAVQLAAPEQIAEQMAAQMAAQMHAASGAAQKAAQSTAQQSARRAAQRAAWLVHSAVVLLRIEY